MNFIEAIKALKESEEVVCQVKVELSVERERTKELGNALTYMETMNRENIELKKDNFVH